MALVKVTRQSLCRSSMVSNVNFLALRSLWQNTYHFKREFSNTSSIKVVTPLISSESKCLSRPSHNNNYLRRPFSQGLLSFCKTSSDTNRKYSQGSDGDGSKPPPSSNLMDFPLIVWPSTLMTLRNFFFATFIIKPYYDNEFSLASFREGAKQALVNVSEDLANGDLRKLSDRVTPECVQELAKTFPKLSLKQKCDLKVSLSDIFFSFPYQLGVIFEDNEKGEADKVFVEITMCYHIYRGLEEYLEDKPDVRDNSSPKMRGEFYTNADRIAIANYRFIREFTKGVDADWTINVINHFEPGAQDLPWPAEALPHLLQHYLACCCAPLTCCSIPLGTAVESSIRWWSCALPVMAVCFGSCQWSSKMV